MNPGRPTLPSDLLGTEQLGKTRPELPPRPWVSQFLRRKQEPDLVPGAHTWAWLSPCLGKSAAGLHVRLQAKGQGIFDGFPCCFLCFSTFFHSTQGDARAPSSENLTTSDLLNVKSEKNLWDHLQGLKLSGGVEEAALPVSYI